MTKPNYKPNTDPNANANPNTKQTLILIEVHNFHPNQFQNPQIHTSAHPHFIIGHCTSRLSGSVELTLRCTTPDIHCRHRWYECDGGI